MKKINYDDLCDKCGDELNYCEQCRIFFCSWCYGNHCPSYSHREKVETNRNDHDKLYVRRLNSSDTLDHITLPQSENEQKRNPIQQH